MNIFVITPTDARFLHNNVNGVRHHINDKVSQIIGNDGSILATYNNPLCVVTVGNFTEAESHAVLNKTAMFLTINNH